jgi:multimeric flavodoxin WrbA
MKVVGFNGSARKNGNTQLLLETVLETLEKEGVETELVTLAGKRIVGCRACYRCVKKKNRHCAVNNDVVNECIDKMAAADGIIIGSPTYFADVSSETKALIDRCGFVARANNNMFARKIGAAVVAARRAGAIHAFDTINHLFTISEMIIVGSSYWNIGFGREPGEVSKDKEGLMTMRTLGRNMAWLLKRTTKRG